MAFTISKVICSFPKFVTTTLTRVRKMPRMTWKKWRTCLNLVEPSEARTLGTLLIKCVVKFITMKILRRTNTAKVNRRRRAQGKTRLS